MPDKKMTNDELIDKLNDARRLLAEKEDELTAEAARKYSTVRDQSRTLDAFFDNTITPLAILDRDFNFVMVNPAYARAGKREISKFEGNNYFKLYPSGTKEIFKEVVSTKKAYQAVARPFKFPNQSERETTYWDWTLVPILDRDDEVDFLVFSLVEVTERKRAEIALSESHALLYALGEAQASYITETDPNDLFDKLLSKLLEITRSEYGFIGQILKDKDGKPYLKNFATTNIAWNKETKAFYEKNKESGLEFHHLKGLFGLLITTGEPVISNDAPNDKRGCGIPEGHPPLNAFLGLPCYVKDQLVGMVAFANRPEGYDGEIIKLLSPLLSTTANIIKAYRNDILRRETEEALKKTEKRFRDIAENAKVWIWEVDYKGRYTYSNPMVENILGYRPEEILGKYFHEFIEPKERNIIKEKLLAVFSNKKSFLNVMTNKIHKTGDTVFCETSGVPIIDYDGKLTGYRGSANDVTERKKNENAVKAERERLFSILDTFPGFVYLQAKDYSIPFANKRFIDHYGKPAGKTCHELIWNREKPCDECRTFDVFKTKEPLEWISDHPERSSVYQVYDHPFIDTDGELLVLELSIDITEKRAAEEKLAKSEQLLQSVLDNSTTVVYVKDKEGRYLLINRIFEELFHIDRKAILGKTDHDIFPRDMADAFYANDLKVLKADKPVEFEEIAPHDDGPHTYISVKFPLKDNEGNAYAVCGISTDITERTRNEANHLKMQKLESIGVLAGGIAHDFNNLLTGILGNVSFSMMGLNPEDKIYARLKEAERASLIARDLTQQLLTFSKGGEPLIEPHTIESLIKEPAELALRGSKTGCEFSIAGNLPCVKADMGQISQVINNLVINADQAMPEGGIIKISAKKRKVATNDHLPVKNGEYVLIQVEDYGTGISAKHLPKIFDPYFTTKQKGSGLGLASVYSIVIKHGGHIELTSEVGVGTTFSIYLPATKNTNVVVNEDNMDMIYGKGKILVMDDEEIIRELLSEFLIQLGYEAQCVTNGEEAIKAYMEAKEAGKPFKAVIMDLTIQGGMGGKETIKELLGKDPETRAIVSSGYSNDPVVSNYKTFGFRGYLNKPYKMPMLSQVLDDVINGSKK